MDQCTETIVWKENYFGRTMNIYEPRGPKYNCSECDEVFNTRLSILTHSKIHMKPFCVICGLYTNNIQEMQNHMKCNHRSLVEVIPTNLTDVDKTIQNITNTDGEEINNNLPKKQKTPLSKRTTFGYINQHKSGQMTKCVVSRFGRCINIKLPDF